MTRKENITAILECCFAGFKQEIIEAACNRILGLDPKTGHWIRVDKNKVRCSKCEFYTDKRPDIPQSWKPSNVEPKESDVV